MTRETSASPTMVSTTGDGLASHEHDDPEQELKGTKNVCRLSTHLSPFLFTSSLEESASSGLSRATGRTPPSRCVLPILRVRRTSPPRSRPESSTLTVG